MVAACISRSRRGTTRGALGCSCIASEGVGVEESLASALPKDQAVGITLAEARTKAADARKMLAQGRDPKQERVVERGSVEAFGPFADVYLKSILPGFKGPKAEADWKRDIQARCKPIRAKRLGDITTNDVLAILSPLWMTINRTARETQSRIERILDAESKGLRAGKNPAMWKTLKPLLPKAKRSKRHHKAAPYKDVPGIVRALRARQDGADTTEIRPLNSSSSRQYGLEKPATCGCAK